MEQEKKNNSGLIVLIIFLFLLVLGLGGYIVYDKLILSNNTTNNNESDNTSPSTIIEDKDGLKIDNNGLTLSDLNNALDILGIAEPKEEVYDDNCMNSYISDNNFRNNSKEIFVWYVVSHKLGTNYGNALTVDTDGDGVNDASACGGAADCGSIRKSDAERIVKLYGLTNMEEQFKEMPAPYTEQYLINYFNLSHKHPITCNISTKHNLIAKYDNDKNIIIIDKQNVTEYDGYVDMKTQVKSQKDQTVTYTLKKDNTNYYLDSVEVK